MSFSKILGQDIVVERLKKSIQNKKIFHSYIFCGPEGVGKKITAITFAKALNCENYLDDACDICPTCKKITSNNHPDVKIINPEGKGGIIKVEQIRESIKDMSFRPYEGKYKIYIFNNAEKMKQESANTFLKMLEEPLHYVISILITTYLESLLPTIISRCNVLKFNYLNSKIVSEILKKQTNIPDDLISPISELSCGDLKRAINEKEKIIYLRDNTISALSFLSRKDYVSVLRTTEEIIKVSKQNDGDDRERILEILNIILLWFRDIVFLKYGIDKYIVNRDVLQKLKNEAEVYTLQDLFNAIQNIKDTKIHISRYSNIAMSLNIMFLNICGAIKQEDKNGKNWKEIFT